jgi:hypothetical protein
MSETEGAAAKREALESKTRLTSASTRRAQLWEGLNRYLRAEAEHAHNDGERARDTSTPGDDAD